MTPARIDLDVLRRRLAQPDAIFSAEEVQALLADQRQAAVTPTYARALAYLEKAEAFLREHPMPSLDAPDSEVFSHQIGVACFGEALRLCREARA